ncbi:4F2 cell-surface antigen heavy chain [Bufo gargarizans]|uniref:4F2 cell-surface antigen heavy chain n=1 Tax=Bufo gargarizans TaxID=30331 RepID=UPI001CF50EE4|nr:4F2 cell-surface antigen heavy chain [Bufo gargarizans]
MTQDTALDMKDVELNEIDPEKQPMAAGAGEAPVGGEKNGVVKVKLEDEDDDVCRAVKFTGLSKEELLKVAGTPGWVRLRWALLVLFWLGWAGMLAGAVVIIVQAPRCRPLPVIEWWNKGPLYQIGDPATFQDTKGDGIGDIAGIQHRLDFLSTLKVKGLVIGPLHINSRDDPSGTNLKDIDLKYGTIENFKNLLEAARKKSIQIVLDLTPNYHGEDVWFTQEMKTPDSVLLTQIKDAMNFWYENGVGGIYLRGFEKILNADELLPEVNNITANHSTDGKARVLLISSNDVPNNQMLNILNDTSTGMLSTSYLLSKGNDSDNTLGQRIKQYQGFAGEQDKILWAIRPRLGHMASVVKEKLQRVYQLLLFTLPGTPLTLYGDEIGLKDLPGQPARGPYMQWDGGKNYGFSEGTVGEENELNVNITFKAQEDDKGSLLSLYKRLSELRGKERALLHGDFTLLHHTDRALAFVRTWDQNERFVTIVNFAEEETEVSILHENVPEHCSVVLSSNPERKEGSSISIKKLKLAAGEALLLKYPYSA